MTYGPLLTKYQENEIEKVQKRCLKCLYGYNKSYKDLLAESGLQSLKDRREAALKKFAQKTVKNPVYSAWFEENDHPRAGSQRRSKKYKEKLARTNRLYKSPLFTIRRVLNGTEEVVPEEERAFMDPSLNDPYED